VIVEIERGLRLRSAGGNLAGDGDEVVVLIRPERIQIKAPGVGGTPGHNRFSARIVTVTYLGDDLRLDLELATGQMLQGALKNAGAARDWTPAQMVQILVEPADLRLLRR